MDHQDIHDLISAGDFEAAEKLFRERNRRHGVSGHDAQIMQAMEKKVRARLAAEEAAKPPPVVERKPALTVVPEKVAAKLAKKPSKAPRRTRRRKDK